MMDVSVTLKAKPKGVCPHCKKMVEPVILEENFIRRDKCQCPECQTIVYPCRAPSCSNFALGRNNYDDELCPDCLATAIAEAKEFYHESKTILLPVILMGAAGLISKALSGSGDKK